VLVAQKVAVGVFKGVTTSKLDELAAATHAVMDYGFDKTLLIADALIIA
jgi:hypothetical protein